MKKLLLLTMVALFTIATANVFGQSTGTEPAPGAKHNYLVTPGGVTNTLKWKVTKGDLTTSAGADAVISNDAAAATDITWGTGLTVGDWYYVHILETAGSCTNEKVLPVQIAASDFYLTIAAGAANYCYNGAVNVSIDGSDPSLIKYDHDKATISFTVTPSGLSTSYTGYSFDLATIDFGGYTGLTTAPAFSTNATLSGSKVTVTDNAAVTITYVIDNTNVFTNLSAANAQDFTAKAAISGAKTINGVSDNGTGAKDGTTAVARPNTSGITTN